MMVHGALKSEQLVMERRFNIPYNWCKGAHTRHMRQKNGIWTLAHKLAGDLKGKSVLDAGCGDGWYSARMLQAGAHVMGIDYSERAIEFAKLIVPDVTFAAASILEIPFADKTFDVVFSFQVLEHLEPRDVKTSVRELMRVLKPGGMAIISVPSLRRKRSAAHFQHFSQQSITDEFTPYARVENVVGQDRRSIFLWIIERILQNRFFTLEHIAEWFNRTVYLNHYNRTSASLGDNLMIVARPL